MIKLTPLKQNEQGMVSILITVVLMIVISITVLSFAQIVRREQREALDNQLSSQAFYAAESGVNAARKVIQDQVNTAVANGVTSVEIASKPTCQSVAAPYNNLDGRVGDGIDYTCLVVDGTPDTLQYKLTSNGESQVFPVTSANGQISSMDLSWSAGSAGSVDDCQAGVSTSVPFPKNDSSSYKCPYGVIRIDIAPVGNAATAPLFLSRRQLLANTFSAVLEPRRTSPVEQPYSGAPNINGGLANQAVRSMANCDKTNCKLRITGLDTILSVTETDYYVRVSTIYKDTDFELAAKTASEDKVRFKGTQVMVDSTGRAQDVLRRIQVRVPLAGKGLHGDYAINTNDSICKKFVSFDASYSNTSTCTP